MIHVASEGKGWWIPEGWGPLIFFVALACVFGIIVYYRKQQK
ncbi:hypothetical protein ABT116_29895 [Streptomyces sp. NPDC002130]